MPKHLLDEANLPDEIEIRAEPGRLIVSAAKRPRDGWADAAKAMRRHGDDSLLDDYSPTAFDEIEWQW